MTHIDYRPPTAEDIVDVAARMRASDVLEVAASSPGQDPHASLKESVDASTLAFTLVINGRPAAIFGFVYSGGLGAEIWMLGTDDMARNPRVVIVEGRRILDAWTSQFGLVHNFVDDRNEASKRWLAACGCTFGSEVRPTGPDQVAFRYFWRHPSV